MADRAAIVTGASRGIGLALAETLGEAGYGLTLSARKPDPLEETAKRLRDRGFDVETAPANMADEEAVCEVVRRHRERFGRLDVLVNSAGVGFGAAAGDHQDKFIDLQLGGEPPGDRDLLPRVPGHAPRGRRRAPQRPRGQPGLDRRQVALAVAVGVLGHQGRRGRLHPGHEQGAERRGDQVRRLLPRLRRHRHDRLHQERGARPRR